MNIDSILQRISIARGHIGTVLNGLADIQEQQAVIELAESVKTLDAIIAQFTGPASQKEFYLSAQKDALITCIGLVQCKIAEIVLCGTASLIADGDTQTAVRECYWTSINGPFDRLKADLKSEIPSL